MKRNVLVIVSCYETLAARLGADRVQGHMLLSRTPLPRRALLATVADALPEAVTRAAHARGLRAV